MKLSQVVPKENIKAVLFNSALLDTSQFGVTHIAPIDYLFYQI